MARARPEHVRDPGVRTQTGELPATGATREGGAGLPLGVGTDLALAWAFWLWFELLALPLRTLLAAGPTPPDVRRVLSRLAGPLLFVAAVWVTGHFVPGTTGNTVGRILVSAALVVAAGRAVRSRQSLARLLGFEPGRRALLVEAAGLSLYLAFVAFRRLVPEMTFEVGASAAEKFMNSMLFLSNWHATALPAPDLWFSGFRVHYYDFAHFHWAWIGRVGGFAPEIALNLALARATVQVFEAAYLLARAAGARVGAAVVAGTAVAWAGNLAALRAAWALWQAPRLPDVPFDWGAYDFWRPSRAIANVVDEFPAFSAILGDFHAHHLALGWLVSWLALLVAGLRWVPGFGGGALAACLCAAAVVGNLWVLPVALWVTAVWAITQAGRRRPRGRLLPVLVPLGVALVLAVGLQRRSMTFAVGPPPVPGAALSERLPVQAVPPRLRSAPSELLDMWGLPVLALLAAAGRRALARRGGRARRLLLAGALAIAAGSADLLPGGVAWVWAGVLLWVHAVPALEPLRALGAAGLAVLAGLELVFVRDRFVGDLVRYNSYFKLGYPVWPVLGAIGVLAALDLARSRAWPARFVLALLAAGALVYPILAIPSRLVQAARGDDPPRRPTLDAVAFVANRPAVSVEAPVLAWIRGHVPLDDVVVEAALPGAYHYGGRVASLCGRLVPLGWQHHEEQWRGFEAFAALEARARAVDALYRAPTPAALRAAIDGLGARWVLFGVNELSRYGPAPLRVLQDTFPVASKHENVLGTAWLFDARPGGDGGVP